MRARCSPLWAGRARAARVAASHRPMRIIVFAALAASRDRAPRARARCVARDSSAAHCPCCAPRTAELREI